MSVIVGSSVKVPGRACPRVVGRKDSSCIQSRKQHAVILVYAPGMSPCTVIGGFAHLQRRVMILLVGYCIHDTLLALSIWGAKISLFSPLARHPQPSACRNAAPNAVCLAIADNLLYPLMDL